MLLHSRNLKHHVAASVNGRYALASIALTEHGTMSTDGHSLMFTPYPKLDPEDLPKVHGVKPASPAPKGKPFLLGPKDATTAAKMVAGANRNTPPAAQLIQAEVDDDAIVLGATDLQNAQVMRVKGIEGQYPEVGAVIPDYDEATAVSINIDQLLRSLKALKGATESEVVTLRVIDDQQAIGFSCKDGTAMLVMPVIVDKPEHHVPCQLKKLRGEGPGVAAPPEPDAEPEPKSVSEEESTPTPEELEDAQSVHDSQPVIPEPVQAASEPEPEPEPKQAKPRRRRRASKNPQDELHAILNG
jgi:hypothetical protein